MERFTKKDAELKARDQQRFVKACLENKHKKLVTRRDFMSLGLMGSAASLFAPSLLGSASSKVFAESFQCPTLPMQGSPMLPFIVIDLVGGAPLVNEFMVGGTGGQTDLITGAKGDTNSAYNNFGIPSGLNYHRIAPNTDLGIRFHRDSALLAGLQKGLNNTSLYPSIDGATIAVALTDDSAQNYLNPIQGAVRAGRTGLLLPTVGTQNSTSGGNSGPASGTTSPLFTPTPITQQSDALNVMAGGNLIGSIGKAKADIVRKKIASLSSSNLSAFSNLAITEQISTLVNCNFLRMSDLPNAYDAGKFFNDPNLTTAFGNNTSIAAVISKLLKEGAAGAATISLSRYDGHNDTASFMRDRHFEAGATIGQIIQYFSLSNMGCFIAIITDGGMGISKIDDSLPNSTVNGEVTKTGGGGFFRRPGDNGATAMAAMLAYVPQTKRGDIVQMNGRQIGRYTADGVDKNYLITASNASNAGLCILNNYLALHGQQEALSNVTGNQNPFTGKNSALYEVFKKMPSYRG
jgi:hypothetical protein